MYKIASSQELQGELQRLLVASQAPNPSRVRIAVELFVLAGRLIEGAAKDVKWTQRNGKWVAKVEYANGEKHDWRISKSAHMLADDKFAISVKTSKGIFKCKKEFSSLEQAQKFGGKFIDNANGAEMLEKVLDKDFTRA